MAATKMPLANSMLPIKEATLSSSSPHSIIIAPDINAVEALNLLLPAGTAFIDVYNTAERPNIKNTIPPMAIILNTNICITLRMALIATNNMPAANKTEYSVFEFIHNKCNIIKAISAQATR